MTRSVAVHAHRGSPDPAAGIAENTVEAFLRAGRLGADGVELDVRLAAAGATDRSVQALRNLLRNAIEHTAPGGRVVLGAHEQPGQWVAI